MTNRLHLFLTTLFILFAQLSVTASGIHSYAGTWKNEQAAVSQLEITLQGDEVLIQVWEKRDGALVQWGRVPAERYDRVSQQQSLPTLTATYELEDRQVLLVLSSNGEKVEVKMVSFSHHSLQTQHAIFQYDRVNENVEIVSRAEWSADSTEEIPIPMPAGRINGQAQGMAKSTASIFHLSLYGPDNPNQVQGTQTFSSDKTYEFKDLPDGTYWLIVDSKAMTGVEAYPTYQEIEIRDGKTYVQNVELK